MTCQLCQRSSSVCTEAAAGDLIVPSISSMLILYGQRIINHQSKSFTQPFLCKEETIVPSPFNLAFFRHNCCIRWKMQGRKIVSILSHWKFAVQLFTRIQWINDNDVNSFMIFKQKLSLVWRCLWQQQLSRAAAMLVKFSKKKKLLEEKSWAKFFFSFLSYHVHRSFKVLLMWKPKIPTAVGY